MPRSWYGDAVDGIYICIYCYGLRFQVSSSSLSQWGSGDRGIGRVLELASSYCCLLLKIYNFKDIPRPIHHTGTKRDMQVEIDRLFYFLSGVIDFAF